VSPPSPVTALTQQHREVSETLGKLNEAEIAITKHLVFLGRQIGRLFARDPTLKKTHVNWTLPEVEIVKIQREKLDRGAGGELIVGGKKNRITDFGSAIYRRPGGVPSF
jgi:hypothetical protein